MYSQLGEKSWSNPISLSSQDDYIENVSAAVLDGNIYVVMNRNNVTIDSETINTKNSIIWTTVIAAENIGITNASYNHVGYKIGDDLSVTVYIENSGETSVDNVTLTITDADSKTIKSLNRNINLTPGECGFIVTTVKPNTNTVPKYTFSISTADITDGNPSDNSFELEASFSNIALSAESKTANTVNVTVTNNGNITDNAVVTLKNYRNDTVITSCYRETMAGTILLFGERVSTIALY